MRKYLCVGLLLLATLAFAQIVHVKSDRDQLNTLYRGGQMKFNKDLRENLSFTGKEFQMNGDFKLNFHVDEKGKISNVKLFPKLEDQSFEREVTRNLMWTKKGFRGGQDSDVEVLINFSTDYKHTNGRDTYSAPTPNHKIN